MVGKLGKQFLQKQKVFSKGVFTLRMKVLKGGFNLNWFEFKEIDTDGDGITGL